MMLLALVKVLHVLSAATWFGFGLRTAGDVRRTLDRGKPHTDLLVARMAAVPMTTPAAATLTVLTGLGLIFLSGGFAGVPVRIHIGFGLTLVLAILALGVANPTWRAIAKLLGSGADPAQARPLARRFAMLTGVGHLLWVAVLALMILPV